jgi:FMN-dependent NADH-azoreductase
MKTLILKGSPRKDGNTATMADRFVAGLKDVGHEEIVEFHLNDLEIRPCQACNGCFRPPYSGCVLDDDFQKIFPTFRDADLVVFAAPIYWWHLCAQMKTFVDRMHPMLTFDRDHCLPTKDLVLITAHFAEDPYGVQLAVKTIESICGWAGMDFDCVRYHAASGHVRDDASKLDEAFDLGRSFAEWERPTLSVPCPVEGCRFLFRSLDHAALHLVMAAGDDHLAWKAENLSATHALDNTQRLVAETREILTARQSGSA